MPYAHRVEPGSKPRLSEIDPREDGGLAKAEGERRAAELGAELSELDDLLYYAGETALLVLFQGRDSAGKDGAIRTLLSHINVQSARVESFRAPTSEELAHDFLWRVHQRAPARGELAIFNRSHYEDVLVVRVHGLVPEAVWSRRYEQINQFERLLHAAGTRILKFFLHISAGEQEERLLARERETEKAWKLSVRDWQERERWDAYTEAYEAALARCSTAEAPWYVVPADRKWFRDLAVLERIVLALREERSGWMEALERVGEKAKVELEQWRRSRRSPAG